MNIGESQTIFEQPEKFLEDLKSYASALVIVNMSVNLVTIQTIIGNSFGFGSA